MAGKKRKASNSEATDNGAAEEPQESSETAQESVQATASNAQRKKALKKKKQVQKEKRKDEPELDEDARRELQRKRQAEARMRQARGELTKKEKKRRKAAGESLPRTPKAKKLRREAAERTKKSTEDQRPNHDMVIIPIFWRQHPGEEEAVVAEAIRVKKVLARAGLDVWVDRTHKLSPGQKLAFWEGQGVRWRVEIGPKDLANKSCVLSLTGVPGQFDSVTKLPKVSTVKCGQLLKKLKTRLGMDKITKEAIDTAMDDKEFDAKQVEASEKNLAILEGKGADLN